MNKEKLAKMQASVRTGGKGSVRRKRKVTHKTAGTDDKKLQTTLKRLGVQPIAGIEEVNLFKSDGNVVHFTNPKVQVAIQSNTFVVSGRNETKSVKDLLPGILSHLNHNNLAELKSLFGAPGAQPGAGEGEGEGEEEDEEVPDLVNVDFEKAAGM